jgi:hypothetical protein
MSHEELFLALHDHLPAEMVYERELLICRLGAGRETAHHSETHRHDMDEGL